MRKGFTLIEILVAVMIVTILVAMAVPMYEKTIEKSRMAEARTMLQRIYESKKRLMDDMELDTYSTAKFGFENLDFTFRCSHGTSSANNHITKCATKDFTYALAPSGTGNINYVCAARRIGDNQGANFLYGVSSAGVVTFNCQKSNDACNAYGLNSTGSSARCTPNVDSVPTPGNQQTDD